MEKKSAREGKAATLILLFTATAIAVLAWQFRLRYPFDDTFITFRYAQHLAHFQGLVWNVGGEHTEGYTNFLYIVLLAPSCLLSIDTLIYAQLINVGVVILSALLVFRLSSLLMLKEFQRETTILPIVAPLAFLSTPLVWINALSAMETSFFGFGILLSFYAFAKAYYSETAVKKYAVPFALSFFTALIRPEGVLLGGIMWVTVCLFQKDSRRMATRDFLLFYLLPVVAYHCWRYWYFGGWLPNSFLIKVTSPVLDSTKVLHGRAYVRIFFESVAGFVLASIGIAWLRWSYRITASIVALVALVTMFYLFPEPLMGYYDRFLYSAEVGLVVLAALGLCGILSGRRRAMAVVTVGAFAAVAAWCATKSPREEEGMRLNFVFENERYVQVANLLKSIPDHEKILLATGEAGIIPFVSGVRNLDLVGLNDNALAHSRNVEEMLKQVVKEDPDLFMITTVPKRPGDTCTLLGRSIHGVVGPHYLSFVTDPRFSEYRQLCLLHLVYDLVVLVKKSSKYDRAIEGAFRRSMLFEPELVGPPPGCLK